MGCREAGAEKRNVKKPKARRRGVKRRISVRQIRLVLEYDGSAFSGWQAKAKAKGGGEGRSVQEELQRAVREVTGEKVEVPLVFTNSEPVSSGT